MIHSVGEASVLNAVLRGDLGWILTTLEESKRNEGSGDDEQPRPTVSELLHVSLKHAVDHGQAFIVDALLDEERTGCSVDDWWGHAMNEEEPLLFKAAKKDHPNVVARLLAHPDRRIHNVNAVEGSRGESPFHAAAFQGNEQIVSQLLEVGANVNQTTGSWYNGDATTPLHYASMEGHIPVIRLLLAVEDIDVNQPGNSGQTALYMAAQEGHTQTLRVLLEEDQRRPQQRINSINIDQADECGYTPLHMATQNGNTDIVQVLVDAGAQIVLPARRNGLTPICIAMISKNYPLAKRLIAATSQVDVVNYVCQVDGSTFLHRASQLDDVSVTQALLERGVDPHKRNHLGQTPLHVAACHGRVNNVDLLLSHNIRLLDEKDDDQNTPIHVATENCHVAVVRTLVQRWKANIDVGNKSCNTALDIAIQRNQADIVSILVQAYANGKSGGPSFLKQAMTGQQITPKKQLLLPPSTTSPVIRKRVPRSQRRRDGLIQFAKDRTSQNGEDGIIEKIFELITKCSMEEDETVVNRMQWCVDVGAWDGRHLSNTYSLLVLKKKPGTWRGILIEADKERFQELQALHHPLGNICVNATVSSDPSSPTSLVTLLNAKHESVGLPIDFDFLSIDVDGSDYWLLHELFSASVLRPRVICIEFNPTMTNDLVYIPPRNDAIRHGASLAGIVELADQYDYTLVETTLFNAFFVRKELYHRHLKTLVPDTSIEALHETTMGTSLYQLYDGTIKLWGCKKLLWHKVGIDEEKLQVLPPSQRSFPFAPAPEEPESNDAWERNYSDQVIDVSSFCQRGSAPLQDDDREKMEACSRALFERLKSDGFALVRGTGMSGSLCRDALRVSSAFLQDADEDVRRSCLASDRARRGYSPTNTENFASLIGLDGPNDLVRKFRIGPLEESKANVEAALSGSSSSLLQPNVWPSPAVWDPASCRDFQSTVEEYYKKVSFAANSIVEAICDGLIKGHSELTTPLSCLSGNASKGGSTSTSILTILGYQTGTRHKKTQKKRLIHPLVAAHTDVGVITVLLFDGGRSGKSKECPCAVLQRQVQEANAAHNNDSILWEDVTLPPVVPDDPVFVVNIADCLSALSHDRLPSTLHRVMPQQGSSPRNCLALFVGLDPNQNLQLEDGDVMYETWRKNRIAKAQGILKSNKR